MPKNDVAYDKLTDIKDYLFRSYYSYLDYDNALDWFESNTNDNSYVMPADKTVAGGCSTIYKNHKMTRSYDWIYSENAEFIVQVNHNDDHKASVGIAAAIPELTNEFVKARTESEKYALVPFYCVDGINEDSVMVSINVVPNEKGNNIEITPTGTSTQRLCAIMLPRYILDNHSTALEAVNDIKEHITIFHPQRLIDMGMNLHLMVADNDSAYVVEFINGRAVATEMERPYITNFHITGTIFNKNNKVYTPIDVPKGKLPGDENNITPHGNGLERYNLIVDRYANLRTDRDLLNLLKDLRYTRTYASSKYPSDPFWYTEYNTDDLTVDNEPDDFEPAIEQYAGYFNTRTREDGLTYHSTHSVIYTPQNMQSNSEPKLTAWTQEDFRHKYTYSVIYDWKEEVGNMVIKKITDFIGINTRKQVQVLEGSKASSTALPSIYGGKPVALGSRFLNNDTGTFEYANGDEPNYRVEANFIDAETKKPAYLCEVNWLSTLDVPTEMPPESGKTLAMGSLFLFADTGVWNVYDGDGHLTPIAGGGSVNIGMFVGNVDQTTSAFPTIRPGGDELVNGDYVKVKRGATLPFTIAGVEFNNAKDEAVYLGGNWVLRAYDGQDTQDTPLNAKVDESLSGTADNQKENNIEFVERFNSLRAVLEVEDLPTDDIDRNALYHLTEDITDYNAGFYYINEDDEWVKIAVGSGGFEIVEVPGWIEMEGEVVPNITAEKAIEIFNNLKNGIPTMVYSNEEVEKYDIPYSFFEGSQKALCFVDVGSETGSPMLYWYWFNEGSADVDIQFWKSSNLIVENIEVDEVAGTLNEEDYDKLVNNLFNKIRFSDTENLKWEYYNFAYYDDEHLYYTTTTKDNNGNAKFKVAQLNWDDKDYEIYELGQSGDNSFIVEVAENQTINGYSVPKLTEENMTDIYNAFVGGKQVVIVDATGNYVFAPKQVDTDTDDIYVCFDFCDVMVLTYRTTADGVETDFSPLASDQNYEKYYYEDMEFQTDDYLWMPIITKEMLDEINEKWKQGKGLKLYKAGESPTYIYEIISCNYDHIEVWFDNLRTVRYELQDDDSIVAVSRWLTENNEMLVGGLGEDIEVDGKIVPYLDFGDYARVYTHADKGARILLTNSDRNKYYQMVYWDDTRPGVWAEGVLTWKFFSNENYLICYTLDKTLDFDASFEVSIEYLGENAGQVYIDFFELDEYELTDNEFAILQSPNSEIKFGFEPSTDYIIAKNYGKETRDGKTGNRFIGLRTDPDCLAVFTGWVDNETQKVKMWYKNVSYGSLDYVEVNGNSGTLGDYDYMFLQEGDKSLCLTDEDNLVLNKNMSSGNTFTLSGQYVNSSSQVVCVSVVVDDDQTWTKYKKTLG